MFSNFQTFPSPLQMPFICDDDGTSFFSQYAAAASLLLEYSLPILRVMGPLCELSLVWDKDPVSALSIRKRCN